MNSLRPFSIGIYTALIAFYLDGVFALLATLIGKPAAYALPLIAAITSAYVISDIIFRHWKTSERNRLILAVVILFLVIGAGKASQMLTIHIWQQGLS